MAQFSYRTKFGQQFTLITASTIVLMSAGCASLPTSGTQDQIDAGPDPAITQAMLQALGPLHVTSKNDLGKAWKVVQGWDEATLVQAEKFAGQLTQTAVLATILKRSIMIAPLFKGQNATVRSATVSLDIEFNPELALAAASQASKTKILDKDQWHILLGSLARVAIDSPIEQPKIDQAFGAYLTQFGLPEKLILNSNFSSSEIDLGSRASAHRKPVALVLPFSGTYAKMGWRFALDFVQGIASIDAAFDREIVLIDSELPPAHAFGRASFTLGEIGWVVGPIRKERAQLFNQFVENLGLPHIIFTAEGKTRQNSGNTIVMSQSPSASAQALAKILLGDLALETVSLFVPQNKSGDEFATMFVSTMNEQYPSAVLSGVRWYAPDLSDLSTQAEKLYGTDRYAKSWLELKEIEPGSVDGVTQQETTIVIGATENLVRIIKELTYQGGSFQTFAGDFAFNHSKRMRDMETREPILFVDHYPRQVLAAYVEPAVSASVKRFEDDVASLTRGRPIMPDLLLYEAGQYIAQKPNRRKSAIELAAGPAEIVKNELALALYPLAVSDGVVLGLDINEFAKGVTYQSRRRKAFAKLLAEKEQELKEKKQAMQEKIKKTNTSE